MKWCASCKKFVEMCVHYELMNGKEWTKEFKDELVVFKDKIEPDFQNHSLLALLERVLKWDTSKLNKVLRSTINVKVKCKDGCIQIERIK